MEHADTAAKKKEEKKRKKRSSHHHHHHWACAHTTAKFVLLFTPAGEQKPAAHANQGLSSSLGDHATAQLAVPGALHCAAAARHAQ